MKVGLRRQAVHVDAPRPAVFELISSFGGVDDADSAGDGEGKKLLERDGNRLLMEFRSRDGRKVYRTVEEVMLYPDERITFRHLEGPLYHSQERFEFAEVDSGTAVTHDGQIECRMHRLPGIGWAVARFYVKRRYERLVLRHLNDLKARAEGAAGI
ncbi:MAG: SRPBCC family protein [Chloroflexi bacterium]|nr:SRPBCC family protein [Chloroflexota bacterium]MDA1270897.1 SRPBCC family protein [Chloroflexota bacterium]